MTIESDLESAGFELVGTRSGVQRYSLRPNPYLQYWVVLDDAGAEFQWEFALGEYLRSKGFHVSVQDELSLLLFPQREMRGPAEAGWLADQIASTGALLASVNLATGE
jgi:hypothetical protein